MSLASLSTVFPLLARPLTLLASLLTRTLLISGHLQTRSTRTRGSGPAPQPEEDNSPSSDGVHRLMTVRRAAEDDRYGPRPAVTCHLYFTGTGS
jgi:hypothetical protein